MDSFQSESLKALRGTRSYMLDLRLGNGGHFGLGCYCESKANLFHDLAQLWTRFSFDKLLPCNEDRLFLHVGPIPPEETDATEANINKFMRRYVFPSSYKVTIYPGGIFNAVICVSTSIKKMRYAVGYDFYLQQPVAITAIHDTDVKLQDLKVEDAQAERVSQHKIFAEALYVKKYKTRELAFGLGGDTTVHGRGIGYDWTLYGKLTATF